jgi:RNA polymerase sigma factor (sigma-70 family)
MNQKEIVIMCEKLANKYKRPQHFQDLVQEGVLVCHEILAQDPNPHDAQLWREANRRMRDYLNLDLHPLSVPNSDAARAISRGKQPSSTNHSEENLDWLEYILSGDVVEIDEFMAYSPDHADEYEKKDYEAYIMSVAVTCLDLKELKVLKERYYEGKSQEELGHEFGVDKATVSRWEDGLLRKIRESLQ